MNRFRTSSLALCATLALTGCPSSTPASTPIEGLGARYAETFCGILTDCYGEVIRNALLGISSEQQCADRVALQYEEASLPNYEQAIADGTMAYDGSNADACIAALAAQGCDVLDSRTPEVCDSVLIGLVPLGSACSINEQCEGDAFCRNDASCPGTCQPRGASGTSCSDSEGCQTGLKCSAGSCVVPAGEDAPCGGSTGIDCAGGLICAGANGTTAGSCRSPQTVQNGALHGSCNVQMTQLCQPGLSCVVESLASMSCEEGGIEIGAACRVAVPDMCVEGAFCSGTNPAMGDLEGTCEALPGAGDACATVVFGQPCGPGLHCEGGTCRETHETGGTCESANECFSRVCESGICVAPTLCE